MSHTPESHNHPEAPASWPIRPFRPPPYDWRRAAEMLAGGCSHHEVATALGCPVAYLRKRLKRSARIRRWIEEERHEMARQAAWKLDRLRTHLASDLTDRVRKDPRVLLWLAERVQAPEAIAEQETRAGSAPVWAEQQRIRAEMHQLEAASDEKWKEVQALRDEEAKLRHSIADLRKRRADAVELLRSARAAQGTDGELTEPVWTRLDPA